MSDVSGNKILAILDEIAATASKNEKQAMVTAAADNPEFVRVCEYAYNPFKIFGIKQIPERNVPMYGGGDVDADFDSETWEVLDQLIARELTGNNARLVIENQINRLSESAADLFVRIIRKDLRAGFGESTINKAVKGLIKEFPYMRCTLMKDVDLTTWPWERGVPSQEKADGMFANVDLFMDGAVAIRSRQGTEFPLDQFGVLIQEIRTRIAPGTESHGELLVMRRGVGILPREIGNGILNSIAAGGEFDEGDYPIYMIWDNIPLTSVVSKGKYEHPYVGRLMGITDRLNSTTGHSIFLIPTKIVYSLDEALVHYREFLSAGKEGTVIKHPDAIWKDGTSKDQVKLKLEVVVDLKITAIVPGRAGTKNEGRAGSVTCETSDGLLVTDVTVKNEKMRAEIDANPDDFIGRILAVKSNAVMKPCESNPLHSLFLPRMVEASYRTDKTEADSLQRVLDQFESAVSKG